MFSINNPNIPILHEEGIEKIMLLYSSLYKQGECHLPANNYVTNIIKLSTDHNPSIYNMDEYIANKNNYCIQIIYRLINAMKEDVETYGIDEYIRKIKNQSNGVEIAEYMNEHEIYRAIHYPTEMIQKRIEMGQINTLPTLIQYLYNKNYFNEEPVGDKTEIPYIINKEIKDPEQYGQGKRRFRVYINNPIGKEGLDFYLIFVNALIEQRIPYNNKFNYNAGNVERKDKSIFYFPTSYLDEVTTILDNIAIKYPNLISQFGTPPTVCAQSTYYGVAHTGAGAKNSTKNRTYNMYINDVTANAFLVYFCKQFLMHGSIYSKLSEEEKNIVKKYSQGVLNKEVFDEIASQFKINDPTIMQIVNKYGNQFNIAISPNDYRNIMNQIVSVRMYGDLDHLHCPMCFNESFYNERIEEKNEQELSDSSARRGKVK